MLSFYAEQIFLFVMLQKLLHIDSLVKGHTYTFTLALTLSKLRFFFRSRADYSKNSVPAPSVVPLPSS